MLRPVPSNGRSHDAEDPLIHRRSTARAIARRDVQDRGSALTFLQHAIGGLILAVILLDVMLAFEIAAAEWDRIPIVRVVMGGTR